jgi:putative addiction module component (TIGR02574 family)
MSALFDELAKKAQTLTVQERTQLVQELLESLERDAEPEVQASWEAELASRIAKLEQGEGHLHPAEEVFVAARRIAR